MGLLAEAVDRKVLAKAAEVASVRGEEARKRGLLGLGKAIYEFVLAIEQDAATASGADLAQLIQRHYLVRAGVFKAIGVLPHSLHAQGLFLAKRLSEVELGLQPDKASSHRPKRAGKSKARKAPAPAGKAKSRSLRPKPKARPKLKVKSSPRRRRR